MVLRLFGYAHSTCTARAATVLREKKIPFEFVPVDLQKGEQKTPAYLEKQPFGQVPCLVRLHCNAILPYVANAFQDDDGFIVYESRAIARYLDAKFPNQGPKLVPTGLKENALFEQAASIELSHYNFPAATAAYEKVFKPYVSSKTHRLRRPRFILNVSSARGLTTDIAVFDKQISELSKQLDVYEIILSKQKYMAGDVGHLSLDSFIT